MPGRGGARPGAGRPKGSLGKRRREEMARSEVLTPRTPAESPDPKRRDVSPPPRHSPARTHIAARDSDSDSPPTISAPPPGNLVRHHREFAAALDFIGTFEAALLPRFRDALDAVERDSATRGDVLAPEALRRAVSGIRRDDSEASDPRGTFFASSAFAASLEAAFHAPGRPEHAPLLATVHLGLFSSAERGEKDEGSRAREFADGSAGARTTSRSGRPESSSTSWVAKLARTVAEAWEPLAFEATLVGDAPPPPARFFERKKSRSFSKKAREEAAAWYYSKDTPPALRALALWALCEDALVRGEDARRMIDARGGDEDAFRRGPKALEASSNGEGADDAGAEKTGTSRGPGEALSRVGFGARVYREAPARWSETPRWGPRARGRGDDPDADADRWAFLSDDEASDEDRLERAFSRDEGSDSDSEGGRARRRVRTPSVRERFARRLGVRARDVIVSEASAGVWRERLARRRRAREMARRRAARRKRRRRATTPEGEGEKNARATDEAPPDALAARIANEARRLALSAVPASSSSLTAAAPLFARAVKRVLPFYRAAADRTLVGASLDDAPCASCGSPEDAASFVLCDGCPNGGHARCMGMRGVPEGDWWCPACVAMADVCGDKSSDEPNGMHTSRREPALGGGQFGSLPPSPPTAGEWACECAGADEMERRGFTTLADEARSRERALVGSAHCSVRSAHRSAPRIPPFWRPAEACVSLEDLPCMRCGDAGDEEAFVLCELCPNGGHFECLGMRELPAEAWTCVVCEEDEARETRRGER